jgi:dTDP-4-dehydrorhamnose 3,5-epimerase
MQVHKCEIDGLLIVELDVHRDNRGFFVERFHAGKFKEMGLPHDFVQDNHSRSQAGVIRGLHYQTNPAQGKLVGVTRGAVWDVAVDIRPNSSTYGKYVGVELTGENGKLLWIPAGFAHGFCVLGNEPADMLYKVSGLYNKAGEGGIRFDDPDLHIDWPISVANAVISDRDRQMSTFAQYKSSPPDWTK